MAAPVKTAVAVETARDLSPTARARAALQSRHADTLHGQLAALDAVRPRHVIVSLSLHSAASRIGQHLGLHLANLLGRLEGVVGTLNVRIDGVDNIPLLPTIDPQHPDGGLSLRRAMLAAAAMAAPSRVLDNAAESGTAEAEDAADPIYVRIGRTPGAVGGAVQGDAPPCHVYAAATNWTAVVGRGAGPECDLAGTLPFGAHAAAAVAAAEVFRIIRAHGALRDGPAQVQYSTWSLEIQRRDADASLTAGESTTDVGPSLIDLQHRLPSGIPPFVLVGVGAVGTACLTTLWSTELPLAAGELVDGDNVSLTNLNRYPLFTMADVGRPKATTVAAHLTREGPAAYLLHGHDQWWADFRRAHPGPLPLVLSAVDSNAVRHQIQDAMPAVILGASTHDLRAQVDRYDLLESVCLKCHNSVEPVETDRAMRERLVTLSDASLLDEADDRGVPHDVLLAFVADVRAGGAGCGVVGGDALAKLRRSPAEGAFAVSFVSALAGTLLAAQLLREAYAAAAGGTVALAAPHTKALVQLWRPDAASNGRRPTTRDTDCWCTRPDVQHAFAAHWRDQTV